MNGEDVRVNGNGLMSGSMAEGEVDPDILAAIAASKQDHHEEEDPAVLAAIEASKQEVAGTVDNSAKVVEEKKEPKKESKGPILMFSTLGRSTEPYDEDDTFDSHVTEEEPTEEEEAGKEEVADDDGDVAEPGDLDPDDAELPAAELDDGEEVGGAGVGEGGKKKKEDFLTPTLRRAYITKVNLVFKVNPDKIHFNFATGEARKAILFI